MRPESQPDPSRRVRYASQRLGAGSVLCSPPTVGQPRQARPRGVQGGRRCGRGPGRLKIREWLRPVGPGRRAPPGGRVRAAVPPRRPHCEGAALDGEASGRSGGQQRRRLAAGPATGGLARRGEVPRPQGPEPHDRACPLRLPQAQRPRRHRHRSRVRVGRLGRLAAGDQGDPVAGSDPFQHHRPAVAARRGEMLGEASAGVGKDLRQRARGRAGDAVVQPIPHPARSPWRRRGRCHPRRAGVLPGVGRRLTSRCSHLQHLHHVSAGLSRRLPTPRLAAAAARDGSDLSRRPAQPTPAPAPVHPRVRHGPARRHAPTIPANAPPKRYSASTPPANRSRSHTSPAQQACPGPGSTASPTCEPRSTDSAEPPQATLSPSHHLNEDQPNRCDNDSRPPSTKSPDSKPTTTNSENTSPSTSATGATTTSPTPSTTCLPHNTQAPNHNSAKPSRQEPTTSPNASNAPPSGSPTSTTTGSGPCCMPANPTGRSSTPSPHPSNSKPTTTITTTPSSNRCRDNQPSTKPGALQGG